MTTYESARSFPPFTMHVFCRRDGWSWKVEVVTKARQADTFRVQIYYMVFPLTIRSMFFFFFFLFVCFVSLFFGFFSRSTHLGLLACGCCACGIQHDGMALHGLLYSYSLCCITMSACVFFTLNRSFYPSTSSTPSVRAGSSSWRDTSSVVTKPRHRHTTY